MWSGIVGSCRIFDRVFYLSLIGQIKLMWIMSINERIGIKHEPPRPIILPGIMRVVSPQPDSLLYWYTEECMWKPLIGFATDPVTLTSQSSPNCTRHKHSLERGVYSHESRYGTGKRSRIFWSAFTSLNVLRIHFNRLAGGDSTFRAVYAFSSTI